MSTGKPVHHLAPPLCCLFRSTPPISLLHPSATPTNTPQQTLVKEAAALADNYPASHRSVYQQAARDLRAPYWDWALEPWLPGAVLPETVTVNAAAAGGSAVVGKTLDNPLYTFRFPREVMQGRLGAFNTYDRMYRCSDPKAANQNLGSRGYKNWLVGAYC